MARYIKANPLVADFLNLKRDRNTVKDGNYLLWQNDMLAFGPLTELSETLKQIGGIALLAHEAREEQDGTVTRPLPVAEDPRFVIVSESTDEGDAEETTEEQPAEESTDENAGESTESDENNANGEVTEGDTETPAEATETADTDAGDQTDEQPAESEETNNE